MEKLVKKENEVVIPEAVSDVTHDLSPVEVETDADHSKHKIEVGVGTETFVDAVEDTGIQTSNEFPPIIITNNSKLACDASVGTSPINVSDDYVETDFDELFTYTSNTFNLLEKNEAVIASTSCSELSPREDSSSKELLENDEAVNQDSPISSSSYDKQNDEAEPGIEFPKFSIPKLPTVLSVQEPSAKPPKASPRNAQASREIVHEKSPPHLLTDESDLADEIPIRESQQKVLTPKSPVTRKVIPEDLASSTESLVGLDMFKSEEYSSAAESGSDDELFNHSLEEVTSSLESKPNDTC